MAFARSFFLSILFSAVCRPCFGQAKPAAGASAAPAPVPAVVAPGVAPPAAAAPVVAAPVPNQLANVTSDIKAVAPGKSYSLTLSVPDADCPAGAKPFDGVATGKSNTPDVTVGAMTAIQGTECKRVVAVTVANDATSSKASILLMPKADAASQAILGVVPVDLQIGKGPGAIPPGMAPSLDLMWKVLPRKVVADNYGDKVADQYFAIEIVLGNDTQYDLQIAAIGFKPPLSYSTPDPGKDKTPSPQTDSTPAPTDSYPIVRGTIVREQSVGRRAIVVNLIKGTTSVLVGVGGYFADSGAFVRAIGISAGPFEKAIELVYPDLSTEHLLNLDSHTLRDGAVISNNTTVRINAFISRELVQCSYPHQLWRLGFVPSRGYSCLNPKDSRKLSLKDAGMSDTTDARMPWVKDFEPKAVAARLGELTLIGHQIAYRDRISILSAAGDGAQSKPGPIIPNQVISLQAGAAAVAQTITGQNLQAATVAVLSSGGLGLDGSKTTVSSDGSTVTVTLDPAKASAGIYQLLVQTPYGVGRVSVNVTKPVAP